LPALGIFDRTPLWFDCFGEAGEGLRIDFVGFGQFPGCFGKVPDLARIYHYHREAGLG
jgi:hypothetical protein